MSKAPWQSLALAPAAVAVRRAADGGLVLSSRHEMQPYPRCLGELLRRWARAAPDRTFLAERSANGARPQGAAGWRRASYAAALDAVERIAGALLRRGLGPERPVAILSENGIDNGLLQLAAMHVGIPVAPISPAYSLMSKDLAQLGYILEITRPGLVYAADGGRFAAALAAVPRRGGVELVVGAGVPAGGQATRFAELQESRPGTEVEARFAAVGPDTIAKILFTSGSTGRPKGVLNTQRMLCSNQQAIAQLWPFLEERPPVIVDWLPWSHTFGGNHNFNMVLRNGGTMFVDGGRPLPGLIETTVANLREISPTLHFNVPLGYDMLRPFLERDRDLRETFFRDLVALFCAAAALPQHLWEALERLSVETTGKRVAMLAAWGSTETAPCATTVHFRVERAGVIGLPVPGTEIKLAPAAHPPPPGLVPGSPQPPLAAMPPPEPEAFSQAHQAPAAPLDSLTGKLELRVRGPQVTPGYWRRPELTAGLFDKDGFLRTGDAGRLADPHDPACGILFDGRLAENFKLLSGAWVQVGELRTTLISAGAPVIQDVVVTGHDRREIGLLVFPHPAGCRSLCRDLGQAAPPPPLGELVRRSEVRNCLEAGLAAHNTANPANSRRVGRALLLSEPPSIDAGEVTDKGYLNQRAVLERRAALVERLHGTGDDPEVIRLDGD